MSLTEQLVSPSVTSLLLDRLHWLNFPERITFKLCVTAFEALVDWSPEYISELCICAWERKSVTDVQHCGRRRQLQLDMLK